jgi:hypothetical protein
MTDAPEAETTALHEYRDPTTGLPWHACPACASLHTRGVELYEEVMTSWGRLQVDDGAGHPAARVGGHHLAFNGGRSEDPERVVAWLHCGDCDHNWSPDGIKPADAARAALKWDWVVEADGADEITRAVRAIGYGPTGGRVTTLEDLGLLEEDVGYGIDWVMVYLRVRRTFWLNEPVGEGETGLNLHPGHILGDASDYVARCGFPPREGYEQWAPDWYFLNESDAMVATWLVHNAE